jgi:hypothetical protein
MPSRDYMWGAKLDFAPIFEKLPTRSWIVIGLPAPACEAQNLKCMLANMSEAFKRFVKLKKFPAIAYIKTLFIKTNDEGQVLYYRCLLLVKGRYYSGKRYVSKKCWGEMWRSSMRVNQELNVEVMRVRSCDQAFDIARTLLLNRARQSGVYSDVLAMQLHKANTCSFGGILREAVRWEQKCD